MATKSQSVIIQDPEILSGEPVFQAIAALEEAKALVLARFGK